MPLLSGGTTRIKRGQRIWGPIIPLDVRFISSLPVKRHPVCMAWVDTKPAQMAWAEG
jgi:hypothetical protein